MWRRATARRMAKLFENSIFSWKLVIENSSYDLLLRLLPTIYVDSLFQILKTKKLRWFPSLSSYLWQPCVCARTTTTGWAVSTVSTTTTTTIPPAHKQCAGETCDVPHSEKKLDTFEEHDNKDDNHSEKHDPRHHHHEHVFIHPDHKNVNYKIRLAASCAILAISLCGIFSVFIIATMQRVFY